MKTCALAAGLRGDLAEGERRLAFGGHSLRAGLASSAQIEEAHVQKHLGHASAEMTRRYQRKRDRFTINLTKGGGPLAVIWKRPALPDRCWFAGKDWALSRDETP